MTIPTIQFIQDKWSLFPGGSKFLEFRLKVAPPVAANLDLIVFSRSASSTNWSKVGRYTVDNIPMTAPGPTIAFPIDGSKWHSIKFGGEAHVLMPSFNDISLGVEVWSGSSRVDDLGPAKTESGTRAAAIYGLAYFKPR